MLACHLHTAVAQQLLCLSNVFGQVGGEATYVAQVYGTVLLAEFGVASASARASSQWRGIMW